MNIKTFTDAPRSNTGRLIAKNIQDVFATKGIIVGVKYIFTPIKGKYHMYIWNQYMDIGIYYQELDDSLIEYCNKMFPVKETLKEYSKDFTEILANSSVFEVILSRKFYDNRTRVKQCNYYQWAKLMHKDRIDWQEKYPEWMQKYRMYKVEKLFEK